MTTEAQFIPDPDYQPRRPVPYTPPAQQSVKDLNAWLQDHHGQAVEDLAARGIHLRFHQAVPQHKIALRVSTDNAPFAFAMPTPVPMQRLDQAQPMVESALARIPHMERAFQAYDAEHEGLSKHQRGQVPVQYGPIADAHGWQLLSEGMGPGTWQTTTQTTASLEDGVVAWCSEQAALRAATSKDNLARMLQDPAQSVFNPGAPSFPSAGGNTCAFELPGLTTERHAFRVYLSGENEPTTGEARLVTHVYMRDAHRPNSVGQVVMQGSTMELHPTGVAYAQGRGGLLRHQYEPDELGVNAMVAGLYIDTQAPMANLLPNRQVEQESYDYTVGLEPDGSMSTDHDFTR